MQETKYANRGRRPAPNFAVGTKVLLSAKVFPSSVDNKKLAPGYVGPFLVLKRPHTNVPLFRGRKHDTFNVQYLKPYEESSRFPTRPQGVAPIAVDYQGNASYLLEGIVDRRLHKKFGWQYKVKWVGYPVSGKDDEDWRQRKDFVAK
jgi:hypothetical protein